MPDALPGVIVAGNIVIDTVVRPGDTIVWGGTQWVESISQHLGGNGASSAYALGKLGVPVRLLGWMGVDSLGDAALEHLTEANVDCRRIVRTKAPTAATVALVAADGQRAFLHRPGASLDAFPAPIDFSDELMQGVKHLHLANPYSTLGLRKHAAESLRRAKSRGLSTSLDTGWDSRGEWSKVLDPCLSFVDLLFFNEAEAEMLERSGAQLAAPVVVCKLGQCGCQTNGCVVDGFGVDAIDTTGAGDCFVGGFLAAWLRGTSLTESARFANAVGALSVTQPGAVTALLDYEATLAWMRSK